MNYLILQKPLGAGQTVQDFPFIFPKALDPEAVLTAVRAIPGLETAALIGGGQIETGSVMNECFGGFVALGVVSRGQQDTEIFQGMYVTDGILRQLPDEDQLPAVPPL